MYVYCIKTCDNAQLVKIGKSSCPERRLVDMQVSNPVRLKLLYKIPCSSDCHALRVERLIHHAFRDLKVRGEWFRFGQHLRSFFEAAQVEDELGAEKALALHKTKAKRRHS